MPEIEQAVISLLMFMAWSTPVFSQSPVPADQAPAANVEHATVQPAPAMTSRKFDDWYYRCTGAECEVAQIAKDGKNVNILTLAIASSPAEAADKGKARLTLTALLPLNIFLPSGLAIKADGKPVAKLAYRNCNQAGCWAQLALDTKTTAALRKGAGAEGLVRLMNGQDATFGPKLPAS